MPRLTGLALGAKATELEEHQGFTHQQVAEYLNSTYETVRKAIYQYRTFVEQGGADDSPPKHFDDLAPEFQAMIGPYLAYERGGYASLHEELAALEAAVDGFELFFNRFSGRTMAHHAREWIRDAFSHRRLLLNVPPRHAKSTYLSVWLPLFLVCGNRNVQILLISQTDDFAQKFCLEIVAHIDPQEDSADGEDMVKAFGRFRPSDGSPWSPRKGELMVAGRERLSLPGDRTLQLRGARQQILGMEADWIIGDDVDSHDVVRSDINRARFREWWDQQVMTRLNPQGRAICIGQRIHINDLYGYLAKKKRSKVIGNPPVWQAIIYPAVLEWPSEGHEPKVLWPELWPYDELMYAYDDLGEYGFSTMYQQRPQALGQRIVKEEWIYGDENHRGCLDRDRVTGEGVREISGGILPVVRVLSVDPSPTENWGFAVMDVPYDPEHKQFNAMVLHIEGRRMAAAEAKHHIEYLMALYAPVDYLVWENSAVSNWLESDPWYNELRSQTRVISHKTHGKSKGDPMYGLQSLAIEFEFGRITFPYGDAASRHMTEGFLAELFAWPDGDYDDQLMALWFPKYVHRSLFPGHTVEDEIDWGGTAYGDATGYDNAWGEPEAPESALDRRKRAIDER